MRFTSTRSSADVVSAKAIAQGIAQDGGLFVPQEFPKLSGEHIARMTGMSYKERAVEILELSR